MSQPAGQRMYDPGVDPRTQLAILAAAFGRAPAAQGLASPQAQRPQGRLDAGGVPMPPAWDWQAINRNLIQGGYTRNNQGALAPTVQSALPNHRFPWRASPKQGRRQVGADRYGGA